MARFSSCIGCALSPKTCDIGVALRRALVGFRVSLVRHNCYGRAPLYRPGDAVLIRTRAWTTSEPHPGYDPEEEPPWCDYQGVFLEQIGPKAIGFIKPGALDVTGKFEFETHGIGFVKVPLSRIKLLPDAPAVELRLCRQCGSYVGLTNRCDGDPGNSFASKRDCVALQPAPASAGEG